MATITATLTEQEMDTLRETPHSQMVLKVDTLRFISEYSCFEFPIVTVDSVNGQFAKSLSANFPHSFTYDTCPLLLLTFYPHQKEDASK